VPSHKAQARGGGAALAPRLRKFAAGGLAGPLKGSFIVDKHGDVDILEDLAGRDADDAVARLDEVVALAAAVLPAERVDEAETGAELFGFDQKASTVGNPFGGRFHGADPSALSFASS
jgi:hypothetical protein